MVSTFPRILGAIAIVLVASASGCSPKANAPLDEQRAMQRAPSIELELMTFNIRFDNPADGENGWAKRRAMVVDVIRDRHADFVGLQEALHTQLVDIGPPAPYGQLGVGRSDGREGGEFSAILYRRDRFDVDETGTFWLSPTPEVPGSVGWGNNVTRVCTWAELTERSSRRRFYVFNTHLDHESQSARALGAELIARRIATRPRPEEPVILMGDLNAGEDNAVVRYLSGKLERASEGASAAPALAMTDTFRAVHPDAVAVGTFNSWTGDTAGPKIDYVFVAPAARVDVLSAEIVHAAREGRYPSDHYPLTARVRLR